MYADCCDRFCRNNASRPPPPLETFQVCHQIMHTNEGEVLVISPADLAVHGHLRVKLGSFPLTCHDPRFALCGYYASPWPLGRFID